MQHVRGVLESDKILTDLLEHLYTDMLEHLQKNLSNFHHKIRTRLIEEKGIFLVFAIIYQHDMYTYVSKE